MQQTVKYPNVYVDLLGENGNAFAIMGRVTQALKRGGHADAVDGFRKEATSGDYDHLLQTCMKWVTCDSEEVDADQWMQDDE